MLRIIKSKGEKGIEYAVLKKKMNLSERQAAPIAFDLLSDLTIFEPSPSLFKFYK